MWFLGESGVLRPSQRPSKRIDCKATVQVVCYSEDMNNVAIEYKQDHNHQIESEEDVKCLYLSPAPKNKKSKKD